ncbi:hypothetical protein AGR7B_Cc260040 [Agrobacterium deltaense RV3]|nr:hypothetical protein AGR7B_Cc260040 [Agrobacterium deltaense RV3]
MTISLATSLTIEMTGRGVVPGEISEL